MTMTQDVVQTEGVGRAEALNPGALGGFLGPKVRLLWNLLNARMLAAIEPFGLHSGAYSTLALISANPGCSQTALARALGMDKSAVVPIIDQLESRGLAIRVRSPEDRRRHALKLTAEGEGIRARMRDPVASAGLPIRKALAAGEMDQLLSLLDRANLALAQAEAID